MPAVMRRMFGAVGCIPGSGKSTLLYTLSGMDRATSGQVIYNEEDIAAMEEKKLAKLRVRRFKTSVVFFRFSAPVGSSANKSLGQLMTDLAIAHLCCSRKGTARNKSMHGYPQWNGETGYGNHYFN